MPYNKVGKRNREKHLGSTFFVPQVERIYSSGSNRPRSIFWGALIFSVLILSTTLLLKSREASANPTTQAGVGYGALILDNSLNMSFGSNTVPTTSKFNIYASSTNSSNYTFQALQRNGAVSFSVRNDGAVNVPGSLTAGSLVAAISANNVSAGTFGSLQGNGNFTFPADVTITGTLQGGTVPWARLSGHPSVTGSTGLTGGGAISGNQAIALNTAGISACTNGTTQKVIWDSGNARLACGTDQDTTGMSGSGSAGYIPKFTAGTTLGNSIIYENGTNVGVGTSGPGQKLTVDGALKLTSNPTVSNDNAAAYFWNQSGIGPTIAGGSFEVRTGGNNTRMQIDSSGNTRFYGAVKPNYITFFNDSNSGLGNSYYAIYQESGAWSSPYPDLRIQFHTGIKYDAYYGYGGHRFYTGYDGTGNPSSLTFSVGDGDQNVRVAQGAIHGSAAYSGFSQYEAATGAALRSWKIVPDDIIYPAGANLQFKVNDSTKFKMGYNGDFSPPSTGTGSLGTASLKWGDFYSDVDAGGTICLTSDATGKMYYSGCSLSSSRKFKKDIKPWIGDWRDIFSLEPITFKYKDGKNKDTIIGYIAEDVRDSGLDILVSHDEKGEPFGLYYDSITIYLTEGIKEHDKEIKSLKETIKKLEARINTLENR